MVFFGLPALNNWFIGENALLQMGGSRLVPSMPFVSLTLGLQAHQCYHSSLEICSRLMTTNDGFISIIINTLSLKQSIVFVLAPF